MDSVQKQQLSLNDCLWSIHRRSLAFIKIAQRDTPLISPTKPLLQDCCHFSSHSFHGLEKFLPSEILAESPSAIQSSSPWGILQLGTWCSSYMTCTEHRDLCESWAHTHATPSPQAHARTCLMDGPFPWVNEYVCSGNTQRLLMSYD